MNIIWNADGYSKDFSFVPQYGLGAMSMVDEGSGIAVDLGCGNGALTEELAKKGYRAIGVDASPEMLALARRDHPGTEFVLADALDFTLEEKADVIFSNSVIHWIDRDKQEALARNISAQMKKGGMFVCEFGGYLCAESIHSTLEKIFAERGMTYPRTFYFPTIGEHATLLEKAGLRVLFARTFPRPTPQKSAHGVIDWINMFVKKPFEGMSDEMRDRITAEAEERLRPTQFIDGTWYVDYTRIQFKAVKDL